MADEITLRFASLVPDVRRRQLVESLIDQLLDRRGEVTGGGSTVGAGHAYAWQDIVMEVTRHDDVATVINDLRAALGDVGLPANTTIEADEGAVPLYPPRREALHLAAELIDAMGGDTVRPTLDFYRTIDRVPPSSLLTMLTLLGHGLATDLAEASSTPGDVVLASVRDRLARELTD